MELDEYFMGLALAEARKALLAGEVPVGAVVACGREVLGKGHNQTVLLHDPTAHAEMLAVTAAASALQSRYLDRCTLYVTLEPCVMCAGAIAWAQLGRLVFGAHDPKRGYLKHGDGILHPKTLVCAGVLADECASLLLGFFKALRK